MRRSELVQRLVNYYACELTKKKKKENKKKSSYLHFLLNRPLRSQLHQLSAAPLQQEALRKKKRTCKTQTN